MNKNRILLEKILMSEDPVQSIRDNIDDLINIIPEIKTMIGFEHNHPHHHLDVWEHTLLAISISEADFDLRLILLLHDIGKPSSCQDEGYIRHFRGHPKASAEIAQSILDKLDYTDEEKEEIIRLILLHDTTMTDEDINKNIEFSKKLYKIQYCDALAHNPDKLEKRLKYLKDIYPKLFDGNTIFKELKYKSNK